MYMYWRNKLEARQYVSALPCKAVVLSDAGNQAVMFEKLDFESYKVFYDS